jgi:hypothetical protein
MGHGAPSRAWQTSGLRWGQGLGSFALYNLYIIYTVYFVLFVLRTTYCLCAFCTSYFVLVLAAGSTATAARQYWGSGPQPVPRFSLTKRGSRRGTLLCGALTNSPAKQSAVGRPKPHHPLLTPLPPMQCVVSAGGVAQAKVLRNSLWRRKFTPPTTSVSSTPAPGGWIVPPLAKLRLVVSTIS